MENRKHKRKKRGVKTIFQIGIFIVLVGLFASCTTSQNRALEATLTFAGTNRAEL